MVRVFLNTLLVSVSVSIRGALALALTARAHKRDISMALDFVLANE